MSQYIIHKDGVYNIYSTVVDAPLYNNGLSKYDLHKEIRLYEGLEGVDALPKRLIRAHEKGISAIHESSLESAVSNNRAGENESNIPFNEFVEKFLTL